MTNRDEVARPSDYEFMVRHYAQQVADLRDENQRLIRERDDITHIFLRTVKWLRGEDPEFSKLIVEFRDSRRKK